MWTYDPAQLSASPLMQLRWLVGDTLSKDPLLQDEELNWALTQRSSIYGAAADSCRALAARLTREADSNQGPLRTAYSSRSRGFAMRAAEYEVKAMARSGGLPYAGQISQTDYNAALNDPDRIGPQFVIAQMDNEGAEAPTNAEITAP